MHIYLISNIPCQVTGTNGSAISLDEQNSTSGGYVPNGEGGRAWTYDWPSSQSAKKVTAKDVEGYKFLGWYTIPHTTSGTVSNATILITSSKSISYSQAESAGVYDRSGVYFVCAKYAELFSVSFLDWDGTALKTEAVESGKSATPPANPTRTGYTFASWSGSYTNVTSDRTITATYTPNTYTVTFNENGGGTPSPASKSVTYGSTYGALAVCSRTGYTFDGWYTAASGGTKIETTTTVAITAAQTLYAHWTAKTVTVEFFSVVLGGTISPTTKAVTFDQPYGTLATFIHPGRSFIGWLTENNGSTYVTPTTIVKNPDNHRLYADSSPTPFAVTFKDWNGTTLVTRTVYYGETATPPVDPTRAGYTFASWSGNYTNVKSNQTITATYTPNTYTVRFDSNGGNTPSPQVKGATYDSTYGALATCTRTGYTFSGWYTAASGGTKIETTTKVAITATQTLYAHWTANSYTVTFDGNGGNTPSPQSKSVTYDSTYGALATCTRTGYTFSGWYTAASGGTKIETTTKVAITAAQTLYAHWTINTYTVSFKDWDNTTLKTETVNHGSSATPPPNPSRSGYTFASWSGDHTNVTSNRTITATYTPNTYTVTLSTNGGTIVSGNVTQYTVGTGATLPTNVTKTGHTFSGWYANEDLSGNPVSSIGTSELGNKVYYAKFTVNTYAVNLQTNGGTVNRGNVTSYVFGNGATLPTDVTRAGHAFGGWFSESDFSGERVYEISPTSTGDKVFYAKWTSVFTVTFEDHDGSVLKTETVQSGGDATPPENPVREGYDFDGWDGDYTNVTSDRTITATYTVKRLTVTFKDFDGTTIGTPQTVYYGSAATAPTPPTHSGYTFTGWSRDFSNVTENIEVVAIYSGAANYTIRGRRWQRLYTAAKATPVYAAESEASLAARTICDVPWTETSGNFVSCLTAHPGTAETDEHNLANREYFDAAAFCAGHENGMHRVHAQATCYRFALPSSAEDKRMNTLKLVVSGDPYLRDGARIAVLTNDTGVIPTDCSTCRTGDVHAEGVAKRTVSADGLRWYGKTDTLQFTPTGGLTLGKYLFVFVILENYAYSRGEYVEGSACIQPNVEIGMATTVGEWTTNGVNLCYEDLSHSYNVCRDGVIAESTGEISGVQTIMLQRSGDPLSGTKHNIDDTQSCFGLRAVYAALYERGLAAVAKSVALVSNARAGAGFVVRGDQVSVGGTNVKTWQLTTAALFVPFAVPVEFRADKVKLDWANWSGAATSGGKFNVWLKRGAFVGDYPADILKNPAIYDASIKTVDGYELLGTIDATQQSKTATLALEDPLGGYVATILLTAFISLDDLNPSSGMTLPQGVATAMNVNSSGSTPTASGMNSGWKPDITLLG